MKSSEKTRSVEEIAVSVFNEFCRREPMFPVGYCDVASFTLAEALIREGYTDVKLIWLPNMKHWLVRVDDPSLAAPVWIDLTISQFYDGEYWFFLDTEKPPWVRHDEPVEYSASELLAENRDKVDEAIIEASFQKTEKNLVFA